MRGARLGIIGDAHLGCANYSEKRRADFVTAFCNALRVCLREQCEAICLLGDVFDSDVMKRNVDAFADTLAGIAPALGEVRTAGARLLAIAGNHEYGRGRRAGELRALEAFGLLHVLAGEEVVVGNVGIAGIPWHEEDAIHDLRATASRLAASSKARRRVLLLHNYVQGSTRIPRQLWEIDPAVGTGFDRVFVGHHHDREDVGPFVMPGSTEVQDIRESDEAKGVIVYDSDSGTHSFYALPRTRRVIVLTYDAAGVHRDDLLGAISKDLDRRGASAGAFVCIRVAGAVRAGASVTRAEVASLLEGRDLFDRYIEVRVSTETKEGEEVIRGANIEHLLRQHFPKHEARAREYIETCTASDFASRIRDRIVS